MQVVNFSPEPHKPCILLQWPNITILLDCQVDYSPFYAYLPHVYQSHRWKNAQMSKQFNLPFLKEVNGRVYVEGVPEINHVSSDTLQMNTVDAILVSNFESLIGLPFYTEGTGFNGYIYMTDIALQFGRFLMEEMVEYFERIDFSPIDNVWKNENICTKFPNPPHSSPLEWRPFYTIEDVESCLSRVVTMSYNQTIDIMRIQISPISNGFSFGSANWTIKTENEKLAYVTASCDTVSHVKKLDTSPLRSCDHMLITSLTRLLDRTPAAMGSAVVQTVIETLKRGGNVLLPISPIGQIFDLLDAVSSIIDSTNGISIDTPIYFVSPIAKSVLAMASISAEWMSTERQNAVYKPEEPFRHSHLIKSGRLRVYDSLYGAFSKEYKTPCVMFTGHTSLRIGDAAHMIEVWGSDAKSCVILTDPDITFEEVRDPFRILPIRFVHCPMDLRLDYSSAHAILNDVKPKYVIAPTVYLKPLIPGRLDLMLQYALGNVTPLGYDEPILLSKLSKNKHNLVRVTVHPDVVKSLKFKQHPEKSNIAIAPISCHLSCYDDKFKLLPSDNVGRKKFGKIDVKKLMRALKNQKLNSYEYMDDDGSTTIRIDEIDSSIHISANGRKVKIMAPSNDRRYLLQSVVKKTGD